MKIWNASRTTRAHGSGLPLWLAGLVAGEAIERLRGRRTRAGAGGPLPTAEAHEGAAEQALARSDLCVLLEHGIDQLPDSLRTVFMLRGIQGMGTSEVADALGISAMTVRARYFRARHVLRAILKHDISFQPDAVFEFAGARCDRLVASVLARVRQESRAGK